MTDLAPEHLPVNPDCGAGKHRACAGDAWDDFMDAPTTCACHCHQENHR